MISNQNLFNEQQIISFHICPTIMLINKVLKIQRIMFFMLFVMFQILIVNAFKRSICLVRVRKARMLRKDGMKWTNKEHTFFIVGFLWCLLYLIYSFGHWLDIYLHNLACAFVLNLWDLIGLLIYYWSLYHAHAMLWRIKNIASISCTTSC